MFNMVFSSRTPKDLSNNSISLLVNSLSGTPFIDLTESNPTLCGFEYPQNLLFGLSSSQNLFYRPDAAGIHVARQTVAQYLSDRGLKTDSNRVILTASTSEAYSYLFKLLADPEDSFLIPMPGYPLLDHLAHLESVNSVPYFFRFEPGWPLDLKSFQSTVKGKLKGFISVNPQNPTGVCLSNADLLEVLKFCADRNIAFISDEVFWDYLIPQRPYKTFSNPDVLTFRLGGLSKTLGLPQLKLSWIVVDGPEKLVLEALERLEFISDSYLSVQTPVQNALPNLFKAGADVQNQIRKRILHNRSFLEKQLASKEGVRLWPFEGGWYSLVEWQKPCFSDEEWVMNLLKKENVLIHPGSFYDISESCFGVLSLLPKTELFEAGVHRMTEYCNTVLRS